MPPNAQNMQPAPGHPGPVPTSRQPISVSQALAMLAQANPQLVSEARNNHEGRGSLFGGPPTTAADVMAPKTAMPALMRSSAAVTEPEDPGQTVPKEPAEAIKVATQIQVSVSDAPGGTGRTTLAQATEVPNDQGKDTSTIVVDPAAPPVSDPAPAEPSDIPDATPKKKGRAGATPKQTAAKAQTQAQTATAPTRGRKRAAPKNGKDEGDAESVPAPAKGRKRVKQESKQEPKESSKEESKDDLKEEQKEDAQAPAQMASSEIAGSVKVAGAGLETGVSQASQDSTTKFETPTTTPAPTPAETPKQTATKATKKTAKSSADAKSEANAETKDPEAVEVTMRERWMAASRKARMAKEALKAANSLLKVQIDETFDPAQRWNRVYKAAERFVADQKRFETEAKKAKEEYMQFIEERF